MELPDQLLVGAIDSHVHAGPVLSSNPGHLDPIQVATEAREAGMRAIVYYDVFGWASGTAWIVNRHVPGIETFGGYLMNSCHGGINPRAVLTALHWKAAAALSASARTARISRRRRSDDGRRQARAVQGRYPEFAGPRAFGRHADPARGSGPATSCRNPRDGRRQAGSLPQHRPRLGPGGACASSTSPSASASTRC